MKTATSAFIAKVVEINRMLERLSSAAADHFGVDPDTINWGHVGALTHHAELLKRITDAVFREGDCAP